MLILVNGDDVTVWDRNVQVKTEKVIIWEDGDDERGS